MKKNKFVFAALMIFTAGTFAGLPAEAEEIHETAEKNTSVGVKIVEPNFWLTEVSDLDFGTIETSNATRKVSAKNDLAVKIKENRTAGTPWKLLLSMETFESEAAKAPNVAVNLAEGKADTSDTGKISTFKATLAGEKNAKIAEENDTIVPGEFTVTIPKEKVVLTLPADTPPGKYQTTLNYVLSDAP